VAVYIIRRFTVLGERRPNREIREARFLFRAHLPEGTTASTRTRIDEIFERSPVSTYFGCKRSIICSTGDS
jgi:hypothetical protein